MIVLINGDSRSGKELLAWYFKKTRRATLLGERTAGSVSGGRLIRICDESVLYCCVSMITIDGKRLEGAGIEPDIEVPFDIRFAAGQDPQLDRAKEELVRLSEVPAAPRIRYIARPRGVREFCRKTPVMSWRVSRMLAWHLTGNPRLLCRPAASA